MQLLRLAVLFVTFLCVTNAGAQTSTVRAEMNAIGQNLDDDTKGVYDRYVYDDAQTVDKKVALSLPVLPNQDIQDWLTDHVAQIMTVTPTKYPIHIRDMPRYFTQSGWQQLQKQWDEAGIPRLILDSNYYMSALVIQTPQIVAKGRQNNIYRWIVDVPVLLTYNPPRGATPQAFNLTLRVGVTRIPMQEDARLVAIDAWGIAPAPVPPAAEKTNTSAY